MKNSHLFGCNIFCYHFPHTFCSTFFIVDLVFAPKLKWKISAYTRIQNGEMFSSYEIITHAVRLTTQLPSLPFTCNRATFNASLVSSPHHQLNSLYAHRLRAINRISAVGRKCRGPIKNYNKKISVAAKRDENFWNFPIHVRSSVVFLDFNRSKKKCRKSSIILFWCVSVVQWNRFVELYAP